MLAPDWASSASSTFTTGTSSYDVFLNFRGEETRKNFTGLLQLFLKDKGFDVFIDSKKLWAGEAIGPALHRAIESSKISIPIFSEGYAHSKWCLQELAQILQCHKSKGQMVLPIFFYVEPSHVRNQIGSFEEAFREHEKNFEPGIINSWREALRVVGNLAGEVINKNKDQAEVVESVVKRVLVELISRTQLAECKYLIGIDSPVNDVLSLLNIGSNDIVQFVGICGFGGIGKTTIAKAVYNRILSAFNRHSFISDVREQSMQCMGLASLQKRLLKDIFQIDFDIGHYHRGKKLIEQRLCNENVLLVLDDVDSKEQVEALAGALNWFGQGSRVIITTRVEYILDVAKVDKDKIYWPQELDREESLQLFSLHAFSMDQPPQNYMQLSHDVVRYSEGLPSTLEVLGSYLSHISNKETWKSTLQKLNTGTASISSLASLFDGSLTERENGTMHVEREHTSYGNSTTFKRVSKSWGEYVNPNGTAATVRVVKQFPIVSKIRAAFSKFKGGNLNLNGSATTDEGVKHFRLAKIRAATKNFNASFLVGRGGFGLVYKGVIDGTLAAFKRNNPQSQQGLHEFETEIEILSKLKHRHIVSLIGFCKEKNEKILVFEYMAKGSLWNHLFETNRPPLTWQQRLEICIGAARGLHCLNTLTEFEIIHRDVKTSNILLDENFVAKMADFGSSRTGPSLGHTHITTDVGGTFGYLDPEYIQTGRLTPKTDVYSFGVVLFEVLCAQPAANPENNEIIANWALRCQRESSLEIIVDRRLQKNYCPESLKKFGEIAAKCLAFEAKKRPTMGEVLWDLEYALQLHESWLKSIGKESTITLVVKNVEVGETEESHNPDSEDDEINFELRTEVFDEESLTWRTNNWGRRVESDEFSQLVNPQCR